MKRFLTIFLSVVMMCGCFAFAEEKKFDYTVLEGLDGYKYDKYERTWVYGGEYDEKVGNISFAVVLLSAGDKETVDTVMLSVEATNANGSTYSDVNKVIILADETLITVNMISDYAFRLLTKSDMEVIHLIATAEEISFKVVMESGSKVLEPTSDELAQFVQAAKIIDENELLTYANAELDDDFIQWIEKEYPITIEK